MEEFAANVDSDDEFYSLGDLTPNLESLFNLRPSRSGGIEVITLMQRQDQVSQTKPITP
jgi:hypothetical protein